MAKSFARKSPFAAATLVAAMGLCLIAGPANAGRWINGGTFDPDTGVATSFLRFLADEGEGQMTVRCDATNGLWVDAGIAGNGQLPEGQQPGDDIDVTLSFVTAGAAEDVTATGTLVLRDDGAVVVSLTSPAVDSIGRLLLQPADRLDITIAGETRSLPLDGVAESAQRLAARCSAWPA